MFPECEINSSIRRLHEIGSNFRRENQLIIFHQRRISGVVIFFQIKMKDIIAIWNRLTTRRYTAVSTNPAGDDGIEEITMRARGLRRKSSVVVNQFFNAALPVNIDGKPRWNKSKWNDYFQARQQQMENEILLLWWREKIIIQLRELNSIIKKKFSYLRNNREFIFNFLIKSNNLLLETTINYC